MTDTEGGSALVAATSLAVLLVIIGVTLAARVTAGAVATSGALHRERALAAAEGMLALTLERFEVDAEAQRHLADGIGSGTLDLPWHVADRGTSSVAGPVESRLSVRRVGPGEVLIEAAGRSAGEERTLVARARRRSVIDHLWITDLEVLDPVLTATVRAHCSVHGGAAVMPDGHDCRPSGYGVDDRFDGPFHSNDVVRLDATATFLSSVTTAWAVASDSDIAVPAFTGPGVATSLTPFGLGAQGRIELPIAARVDAVDGPTCRFRGPTVIRLVGGSIRVRSPLSARGGEVATGPVGCPGLDVAALSDFVPIALADPATIEVARGHADDCGVHPLGITEDDDRDLERACFAGDAFVWGEYDAGRAIVAHDDVVIVRDIVRGGPIGTGFLALVAGDSVVLRRPIGPTLRVIAPFGTNRPFAGSGTPPFGAWPLDAPLEHSAVWDAPLIEASLVALRGSVRVENPAWGQEHAGRVTIRGSIAQRFRGAFRWERRTASGALQGRMGYGLDLVYDRRLLEGMPPGLPDVRDPSLRILDLREIHPGVVPGVG
jgi:hypothetical protein